MVNCRQIGLKRLCPLSAKYLLSNPKILWQRKPLPSRQGELHHYRQYAERYSQDYSCPFYAACSNQSDMDFLLHQRDLPGVAKRLTLADILRHEIDLRAGPNLQRVASRSSPGHSQVAGCSGRPRATLRKAQRAHLPQRSQQARAARETPASRKCWPCRPFRSGPAAFATLPTLARLAAVPHCHPAACPRRACRNRVGTCQCRGRLARRASMRPRCLPCDLARAAHCAAPCAASCVAHCAPIPGNA